MSSTTHPAHSILGIGYELLISAEQTAGSYELMKFVVPPGQGPPPHIHQREDECFYVVEGAFEITQGDTKRTLAAGEFVHLNRGLPHAFRNVSDSMSTFLCWVVPGNLAGFFDAFKVAWPANAEYPSPPGEADIANLMAAAPQFEIQMIMGQ